MNYKTKISSNSKRNLKHFISKEDLFKCKYIIIAIGAQYVHDIFKTYKFSKEQKILIASKGIDVKENKFLNQICQDYIDEQNIGFLTGPSFSQEVMNKLPTALCISSKNDTLIKDFTDILKVNFIKIYKSHDIIGSEVAGAYKNTIAIASGICNGLKLGNNAQASLISRGLVEMHRFGEFFGASQSTFLNISGAGDLFLTANSTMSRNFRLGVMLADNITLEQALSNIDEVVEGVQNTFAIYNISKKNNIYTPIVDELYSILHHGNIQESIKKLLS
jgi:glycerol-3-phosphate dehydrogenase (NAD(P)+)